MKPLLLLLAFLPLIAAAQFPAPYCAEDFSAVHPIKRFKFSNVDNYSSDALNGSQHEDFTSTVIDVTKGSSYKVTVEAYCIYDWGNVAINTLKLAIDFNQDGIFQSSEDVGYLIFGKSVYTEFRTLSFNVVIPYNKPAGTYRFRIIKSDDYPTFCAINSTRRGQAEDYTIHINNATCFPPTKYNTSSTYTSATVSWGPPAGSPVGYEWEFRKMGAAGSGSDGLISSGNLPYSAYAHTLTFDDLAAVTDYYFYIRSDCGGSYSIWQLFDVRTSFCGNNEYSYYEIFGQYTSPKLPDCIVVQDVNGDGIKWEQENGDYNNLNQKTAAIHITSNGMPAADDWFFTPSRTLKAGQAYVLKFLYKGAKADSGAIQNLEVKLGKEQKAAGMYKILFAQNDIASLKTSAYQSARAIFIPDSTGAYTIGFHCWSNANKVDFYMDDISFGSTDCTWPDSVAVTNVTGNSVRFNWKKGYTSLANPTYKWEIRTKGATPASASYTLAASGTVTNRSDSAVNLLVGTPYDIFIKTECAAGGFYGAWSDPFNFTTTCLVDSLPYAYIGTNTKVDSGCLKAFDANMDGQYWLMSSIPDLRNVTAPLIRAKATNDNDDWLFTPYFNLKADSAYLLSFTYNLESNNLFYRSLEVKYGINQQPQSMHDPAFYQNTMIINSGSGGATARLKVPQDGIYTIGFHNYDEARINPSHFMIYNYSLKTAPLKTLQPKFLRIDSLFATGLTVRWNAPDSICPGNLYQWEVRNYYNTLISSGSTTETFVTFNYQYPAILRDNFLIRSVCQATPDANWSVITIPNSINCYLTPNNVPFFQENFAFNCLSFTENTNNDGYEWTEHVVLTRLPKLQSDAAVYRGNRSVQPADDWLFTSKINLKAGKSYKLSFRYKSSNGSDGKREKLEVKYGFDAKSFRMFAAPLFIDDNITTDTSDPYLVGEAIINVSKDSSYNFGFHCFSEKDQARLFLDSVLIVELSALPVTEMNLQAIQKEANILLTWNTMSEINNTGFEIQRSADGQHFSKIHFKPTKAAGGNSNSALYYDALDNNPLPGDNYYRLKQIDKNGIWHYSNIVVVNGRASSKPIITSLYPNPATSRLHIQAQGICNSNVAILIADIAGRKMFESSTGTFATSNLVQIDISKLPKGVYVLQLQCPDGNKTDFRKFEKR